MVGYLNWAPVIWFEEKWGAQYFPNWFDIGPGLGGLRPTESVWMVPKGGWDVD